MEGRVSLDQLIEHLQHIAPRHTLSDFYLNVATVSWEDDATAEEQAELAEWRRRRDERNSKWERETYLRLREKFEGPSTLDGTPSNTTPTRLNSDHTDNDRTDNDRTDSDTDEGDTGA